jgi:hypothetical protein
MVLLDHGCVVRGGLQVLPPPADLRDIVEHTFIELPTTSVNDWRVVPDASPHLIVTVLAQGNLRAALVGARSRVAIIDRTGRVATVGVRLRPGALSVLVRDSAREFLDRSVTISDAFPRALLEHLDVSRDAPPSHIVHELLRLIRRAASSTAISNRPLA